VRGAKLKATSIEKYFFHRLTEILWILPKGQDAWECKLVAEHPDAVPVLLSRARETSIKGLLLKTSLMASMSYGMYRCEGASIS